MNSGSTIRKSTSEKSSSKHRIAFRTDIEGLRAIAVLLVVLGHAGVPFFTGGYVGVDVFFVISGFLITSLLLTELRNTGTLSIRRFYARRMVRLLPAAAAVMVATLVAAWLWLPATRYGAILMDAVSSAFYFVNYRLAVQGTDYLAADEAPSPLQHFWSLSVEEQFYLVWPLLLLAAALAWRGGRRLNPTMILVVLVGVTVVSLAASMAQTESSAPWAYFGIHTRAWELAIGAIVALAIHQAVLMPRRFADTAAWVGLTAIVVSGVAFTAQTAFPGWVALLPVLGTASVIYAGASRAGSAARLLSLPPMTGIGAVSYGWYLWHWPILLIGPAALGVDPNPGLNVMLSIASLAVAILSYHFLENPIRRKRWFAHRSRRGLGLGAALSAGVAVVVSLGFLVAPSTTGEGDAAEVAAEDVNRDGMEELLEEGTRIRDVPVNLTPSLDDINQDIPPVYGDECHADFDVVELNTDCVYGDPEGDRMMILFGDSHAAHWFPALDTLAKEHRWQLVNMTKSACAVPMVTTYTSVLGRNYDECIEWRNAAVDRIQKLEADMVVMPTSDGGEPADTDTPDEDWVDGFLETVEMVQSPDTELVHIADTPWFDEKVPDCLAMHLSDATECVQSPSKALVKPERRATTNRALQAEGVTVIDPMPWFCTDDGCPVIVENLLMFRDRHHISSTYAETLAPLLGEELGF